MQAVLSQKPKRVSVFIKNGQIYEGRIDEAMGDRATYLGSVGGAKKVGGAAETDKEDTKE